jgi:hypothetical protein
MMNAQDALIKQLEVAVGELMPSVQARYDAELRLYEEQEDQRKREEAEGQPTAQRVAAPPETSAATGTAGEEDRAGKEKSPAAATDPGSTHDEEHAGGSKS